MARKFLEAKPLQATKLGIIVGGLVFGIAGLFNLVPGLQLPALLLVTFLGPAVALVVVGETLFAGYRIARADDTARSRLVGNPTYTVVRVAEAAIAILATGGLVVLVGRLPDEPLPAPAGVGLLLLGVALGLLTLVASLVRSLVEYYYRRDRAT